MERKKNPRKTAPAEARHIPVAQAFRLEVRSLGSVVAVGPKTLTLEG
jgi:hypothetical protein